MVAEVEIKLNDLAKLALGTPQLTHINVAILQSLIEILLTKLNCQNETVSLNAHEAKHLENLLKTAKVSPLGFNNENVERVAEKLERLKKLQENLERLDKKLDIHLEEAQRKDNLAESRIDLENWSNYGVKNICSICDPENELACTILKDTDFLQKLQRRMAAPIIERLFYFETKVEKLNQEFANFIERARDVYLNVKVLEKCIQEIEKLRETIEEQKRRFLMTMEEIQDMLDSKLDKIHVPGLKKYIRDNFAKIDQSINSLQNKETCPRAAGIITGGIRCASCGNSNVCSEVGTESASMLPDVKIKHKSTKKYCGISHAIKSSQKVKAESWSLEKTTNLGEPKIVHLKQNLQKCGKAGQKFDLLEGFDGQLYRKG